MTLVEGCNRVLLDRMRGSGDFQEYSRIMTQIVFIRFLGTRSIWQIHEAFIIGLENGIHDRRYSWRNGDGRFPTVLDLPGVAAGICSSGRKATDPGHLGHRSGTQTPAAGGA